MRAYIAAVRGELIRSYYERADNLAHFCRRHHTDKHQTAWRVRQLGRGVIEWIGPTGRRYADRPPAVVRFVPLIDDPPPPF